MSDPGEITRLLDAYRDGDRRAFDELVPIVYGDLRRIARAHLRGAQGRTLNTTGLVHEAWVRLAEHTSHGFADRKHFLSVCARAMRNIVIDDARRRAAAKRGGAEKAVTLDEQRVAAAKSPEWMLALDQALERLAQNSPRLARTVECRFFAGLTEEETAEALEVSLRTVQRDWMRARAWLREDLGGAPEGSAELHVTDR